MNDRQFIDYCADKCAKKALFVGKSINRMIRLAGNPRAYQLVPEGRAVTMREEMQRLVDLARLRIVLQTCPLDIRVDRVYEDVNGDRRLVVDMAPHGRTGYDVDWVPVPGHERKTSSLREFKAWAVKDVSPVRTKPVAASSAGEAAEASA